MKGQNIMGSDKRIKMRHSTVVHINGQRRALKAGEIYTVPAHIADDFCKDRSGTNAAELRRKLAELRERLPQVEAEIERIAGKAIDAYTPIDDVFTILAEKQGREGLLFLARAIRAEIEQLSNVLAKDATGATAEPA